MTLLTTIVLLVSALGADPSPLTVAEESGFEATATHAEVMQFCRALDSRSDLVELTSMGRSFEGRTLPLLIIADPPVSTPDEARASGKLVLFILNNIHGGEVCGKEASLMLARDLALHPDESMNRKMLEKIIFLIAPVYNADGNDRMALDNRPGQIGPARGMGERANAQGLDLNRDHIKLESPEARAMVALLNAWDPHLTIDTHTTNGSEYRYDLTYAEPMHPSAPIEQREYLRTVILPEVSKRMLERTGRATFFYGNFNPEQTEWVTYSCMPRFGTQYRGLRGRLSILSEAYAHVSYKDRVLATYEFLRECSMLAADHWRLIHDLHTRADEKPVTRDVGLRHFMDAYDAPAVIAGYTLKRDDDGTMRPTDEPADVIVRHRAKFIPTLRAAIPEAYLIPPEFESAIENLRLHGIEVTMTEGMSTFDVEVAEIREASFAEREFQGHRLRELEVEWRSERRAIGPGWAFVKVDGRLGPLIVTLLEPESEDGLTTWNFFDGGLNPGSTFPVLRVPAQAE